jgi:hypothetical protein
VRNEASQKYGKEVDDGIVVLRKAIDLNKDYDNAMSYLNLLLRVKADLEDSKDAAKRDIEQAEYWAGKFFGSENENCGIAEEGSQLAFESDISFNVPSIPKLIELQRAALRG